MIAAEERSKNTNKILRNKLAATQLNTVNAAVFELLHAKALTLFQTAGPISASSPPRITVNEPHMGKNLAHALIASLIASSPALRMAEFSHWGYPAEAMIDGMGARLVRLEAVGTKHVRRKVEGGLVVRKLWPAEHRLMLAERLDSRKLARVKS
ncbi:hypothetical protein BDK51DRAFT_26214 [Blyttiomyces helicus]|uniref:Uncharacterized protein n=1 Tax=Blyttiomyces helicus TaxID=388810 RepID=A0A4P9WNL9_9FUNG|nr:hypothetical protein BDK51DRAFT_26214 [Blyttiomyces helicus]|eukprot:RKO93875.1 hypothetical protein BDK51DRAFT_26214 [Blyttiomyces helicus]